MVRGAEAAVFFEDLILEDHLDSLSDDAPRAWKNLLPIARLTPAVHYLKAQQTSHSDAGGCQSAHARGRRVARTGGRAGPSR